MHPATGQLVSLKMKRIKVLHLTKSEGLYGAERVILNLLEHFDAEHFDVRLAALVEARNPHRELLEEAARRGHRTLAIPCRKRLDPQSWRELLRVIKENEIDVLHCHEIKSRFYGLLAAKRLKLPIIATNHNWIRKNLLISALEYWDAFTLRFFDRIIAVSEEIRQLMLKYGTPAQRMAVVTNGIATRELEHRHNDKMNWYERWGIASHERIIGAVGRLSVEKGAKYFLEAAKIVLTKMPDVRFLLVGDGPQARELKEYAQALGIEQNVIFAGFQPEVAAFYELMEIFAITSLREGTPMALLEAMATGVPVVATAVGGVPKIVRDRDNGMLVPAQDAQGIAAALLQLLQNRAEAARLASNAKRTIIEKYSAATMARQYENIYAGLVQRRQRIVQQKVFAHE